MDAETSWTVNNFFIGKYLIPTDNIWQHNERICKQYMADIKEGKELDCIFIATNPPTRIGEIVNVNDIVKTNEPIYIIDGHHRYIASLSNPDYVLRAVFVNMSPDIRTQGTLYDYLDTYEAVSGK